MASLGVTKESFVNPAGDEQDLLAEGVMNRVFRVAEEAGHVSEQVAVSYGFERHAILGVRNRLAHAYGEVDRELIWEVVENDFDSLLAACRAYCDDEGIDLR
ncbi:MAG: DUF86 domain-containing protein [Slackia sp.]|nr:DUF86 domain-containing protein [Slackia sp.]